MPGGECVATLRGHSYPVNALAVAPDGETIFSGSSDETVRVWALREYNLGGGAHRGGGGECVATLRGHSGAVWALEVSPDGETLFSGSGDKTVRMWSVRMGIFPRALPGGGEGDGSGVTTLSGHSRDVKARAMAMAAALAGLALLAGCSGRPPFRLLVRLPVSPSGRPSTGVSVRPPAVVEFLIDLRRGVDGKRT